MSDEAWEILKAEAVLLMRGTTDDFRTIDLTPYRVEEYILCIMPAEKS